MSDRLKLALVLSIGALLLAAVILVVVSHMKNTYWKVARFFGEPIPVQVVPVRTGSVDEALPAEGVAKEFEAVPLSALVTGTVTKINARLGDTVRKGERLIEFDTVPLLSALSTAQEQLAASKEELALHTAKSSAMQELFKKQLVAESELHEAVLKKLSAQKNVAQHQDAVVQSSVSLAAARIDSPVNGIITVRDVYVGTIVKGQTAVITVAQTAPILIHASYPEDRIRHIYVGQPARVSLYAFPGRLFEGKVRWINPTIDHTTRLMTVHVALPNLDLKIQPGMRGIVWLGNRQTEALRVPSIALLSTSEDFAYVFVVNASGTAQLRKIRTGAYAEGYMEVKSGLQAGERVVVAGQVGLQDNDKVRIFNADKQPPDVNPKP